MANSNDGVSLGHAEVIKAILVNTAEHGEMWIPQSAIHNDSGVRGDDSPGSEGDLIVETWWARERGLI